MHEYRVPVINRTFAAIAAIVGKDKFIPAQGLASVAFKTYRAQAAAAIAGAKVKANHNVALIFVTG
jgi:hypothetical protein